MITASGHAATWSDLHLLIDHLQTVRLDLARVYVAASARACPAVFPARNVAVRCALCGEFP
jgi:hypothetical protein